MGRPLNKKYFGNRNIGTNGGYTADDGIGGEGVASAAVTVAGSYTTLRPAFTFTAPTLPGGVTATGTITSEVLSATISGGTGYGNAQTFDLTVNTAGGTAVLNVTSDAGGAVTTVNSITSRGEFTTIGAVTSVSGGTGTGAVPVLTYRANAVVITNKGSGYVTAPTVAGYTNQGGVTVNTIVLTTDSGVAGSATNQENAIIAYAFIPVANGGSSAVIADIKKQTNDKRFKVKTAQGTGICQLKTSAAANAAGEMTIKATDQAGKTYYVAKITSRKAVLVPYGASGHQFPLVNGAAQSVKWTFGAAVAPSGSETGVVTIENA
jgi:hypothetical protein